MAECDAAKSIEHNREPLSPFKVVIWLESCDRCGLASRLPTWRGKIQILDLARSVVVEHNRDVSVLDYEGSSVDKPSCATRKLVTGDIAGVV